MSQMNEIENEILDIPWVNHEKGIKRTIEWKKGYYHKKSDLAWIN
jgi:hypothetical protein